MSNTRPDEILQPISAAPLGLADYSQVDILGSRYKFVNFGAERIMEGLTRIVRLNINIHVYICIYTYIYIYIYIYMCIPAPVSPVSGLVIPGNLGI